MNRLNSRFLFRTLITINFLITSILAGLNAQNNSPAISPVQGSQQAKPPYSYKDNAQYVERMSHFEVYRKKGRIVMLGNSITARVNWSELLGSDNIINRGIGSDITEGYLSRMEYIYSIEPKICYIMGGVNDIARNVPREEIVENVKKIIDGLKEHKIIPVLQSVLHVTDTYPNNVIFNQKIENLNVELVKLANECNITFLDLNAHLSSGNQLISEYAIKDGIHLSGAGYEKWRTVLLADLKKHRVKP
jgi:lysophospholipase L1-like esterase